MSKTNKILLWGIGVILVIVAVAVMTKISSNPPPSQKQTIKIGVTLPLTGGVAMLGQSAKNAILLAESRLSRNNKYDYELVFEDDQFKPATGASVANKLINIDKVDALISFGSPVGSVVSPIAERSKILHINDFASASQVADGDYNFVHYTPPYEDSKLFIEQLEKRGIKKLVFFGQQDNPGVTAIINAFEADIKETDIEVVSSNMFNTGTRDFRTMIDKSRDLGADMWVLEANTPELEILARQIQQSGIKTPLTTMEAFEFSDELSLFEGMWYVNGADSEQWFIDLYTKAYSEGPKFGAANAYDVLNLIVRAVESAGNGDVNPTRTEIRDVLARIPSFDGALGKDLKIDAYGVVVSRAVVRMIKDGRAVTIEP